MTDSPAGIIGKVLDSAEAAPDTVQAFDIGHATLRAVRCLNVTLLSPAWYYRESSFKESASYEMGP